jgi:peptide/nickel transport system substrate-binding protein
MEWAAFIERIDAGNFEAASLAWSATDPNPDPYPFWHSSQAPPAGVNNGFYRNPETDRLMEQARSEPDERRRLEIYHRLHRILRDDAPAVFVTNASLKYLFSRRVRGLATSPLGLFGIWPGPAGWWEEAPASRPRSVISPGACCSRFRPFSESWSWFFSSCTWLRAAR